MIRIDAVWLATIPLDLRAGTDSALARVVRVFGAAHHNLRSTGPGAGGQVFGSSSAVPARNHLWPLWLCHSPLYAGPMCGRVWCAIAAAGGCLEDLHAPTRGAACRCDAGRDAQTGKQEDTPGLAAQRSSKRACAGGADAREFLRGESPQFIGTRCRHRVAVTGHAESQQRSNDAQPSNPRGLGQAPCVLHVAVEAPELILDRVGLATADQSAGVNQSDQQLAKCGSNLMTAALHGR